MIRQCHINYKVSSDGVVNFLQEIASQMETATRNHLKLNFFGRLKNYKKLLYQVSNPEESEIKDSKLWSIVRESVLAINKKFKIKHFSKRPITTKKDKSKEKDDEKKKKEKITTRYEMSSNIIFETYWKMLKLIEQHSTSAQYDESKKDKKILHEIHKNFFIIAP